VPVICGPTAAGKSAMSMWLAERFPILVISADSRQIYRRFDIGTAKPGAEERLRVPHRGIDVADAAERFSAAQWVALAQRAIGEAHAAGRIPVIVGGTGFYIGALFRPLWLEPPLDAARRAEIQEALVPLATDELRRWCQTLDPARAHLGRVQLLRAIEVALLTGERLSEMHVARSRPAAYHGDYLLVDPGPELASRIARRTTEMLVAGWPDEVRHLMQSVPSDAPAWHATGYDVVRRHVHGELDRDTAIERIVIETRQYAKRQRTWFRHQLPGEQVRRLAPVLGEDWQTIAAAWMTAVAKRGAGDGP
jgi:tRNA dimethylallyltransferase